MIHWRCIPLALFVVLLPPVPGVSQTIWLDELDLATMEVGYGTPRRSKSITGKELTIAGQHFERGVGTHAISTFALRLNGVGKRFKASVGLDSRAGELGSVAFYVVGDGHVLWKSGVMKKRDLAREVDIDIQRIKLLGLLVTDAGDGIDYDHADWADARLELSAPRSRSAFIVTRTAKPPYILTPRPSDEPRINGAKVFGVRLGHPFLFTIAATGKRPMTFGARNLPKGLALERSTGQITGVLERRGEYTVTLMAQNGLGVAERELRIVAGDQIALTPPMGWNSRNCWGESIDDAKVRAAADAMVESGLADHGWTYINIDDGWAAHSTTDTLANKRRPRESDGRINANSKFPNMVALSDYIHSKGLKMGIYSSPGRVTSDGYTGSYLYESADARRFGEWKVDYLKYDWCFYSRIARDNCLPEFKKPYVVMRAALDSVRRDIVYSIAQYGWGNVWDWGGSVGANCWRTFGDIYDSWIDMTSAAFHQAGLYEYVRPGNWNDPDLLLLGGDKRPTRLTPDEQYTHMSLWVLLAAPLLISCDLERLDEFTLNLLTNDEVIAVNQDPLGRQARCVYNRHGNQVWVKDLEDGSKAVGLFHIGGEKRNPVEYFVPRDPNGRTIAISSDLLGIKKTFTVRDLWRQKDLGTAQKTLSAFVPYHGVQLLRVTSVSRQK
jgi:alpha-galactosidase